jgi:hypothetical protein
MDWAIQDSKYGIYSGFSAETSFHLKCFTLRHTGVNLHLISTNHWSTTQVSPPLIVIHNPSLTFTHYVSQKHPHHPKQLLLTSPHATLWASISSFQIHLLQILYYSSPVRMMSDKTIGDAHFTCTFNSANYSTVPVTALNLFPNLNTCCWTSRLDINTHSSSAESQHFPLCSSESNSFHNALMQDLITHHIFRLRPLRHVHS